MKVLLVNHSDTAGGASVVTHRLLDALCELGVDARMLVVHKNGDSLRVGAAASGVRRKIPFLLEHADIFRHNGFRRDTLFRISTARYGLPLHRHPWVRQADIVVLNWINQGMLSLRTVKRIAALKPVVWTMHDQWNMTGVCHYTSQCRRWMSDCCHPCPLVGRGSLARKIFEAKRRLYADTNIRFVAVSHALADLCRSSALMAGCDISVIPNAFPVDSFPVEPSLSRHDIGLPDSGRIIVMGAARLDDPVKNLPLAVELLNTVADTTFGHFTPVFFGHLRDRSILQRLAMPYLWMGPVADHNRLQSLFAHADIVLSTSVWETLPGTVVEGVSCGAYAITTDNGGQRDIIVSPSIGRLIGAKNAVSQFSEAMESYEAYSDTVSRGERHKAMAAKFSAHAVARAYVNLFHQILNTDSTH